LSVRSTGQSHLNTVTPGESLFFPDDDSSLEDSSGDSLLELNSFLRSRDVSPVRHTLITPWFNASDKTRRYYTRKAFQGVTAVLEEIAPCDADSLWQSVSSSTDMCQRFSHDVTNSEHMDTILLGALTECYNAAGSWASRRQILSIMADKVSLNDLRKWIPDLTKYRYTEAKRHCLLYGRGEPVTQSPQSRISVSTSKIDHFINFITSPHLIQDLPFGEKTIKLSSDQLVKVPNVIRTIIPERVIQQYQEFCRESAFTPLSRSTLLRILKVCPASLRTSLQGLDYISSTGAEAFDDLESVTEILGDFGQGMAWAKQQQNRLKAGKRYLKTDYKVMA
jgi:hypothetical protein